MQTTNIRVYGIIINDNNQVLLSDELRHWIAFTKFPGGGLEWGEGTKECLTRELLEELNLNLQVGELFYVNDFAQLSAFRKNDQLFSFYYKVESFEFSKVEISNHSLLLTEEGEKFRWVDIKTLTSESVTFPIDKVVAQKLSEL